MNPTITGSGYTEHKCVYCGDTYRDSYVDKLGQDVYGSVYLINSKNGGVDLNRPLEDVIFITTRVNMSAQPIKTELSVLNMHMTILF